jgi:hypothetical protein
MDRPSGGSEEQRCLKNQEKRSLRNTDLMEDEVTGCTPKESIENPVNRLSQNPNAVDNGWVGLHNWTKELIKSCGFSASVQLILLRPTVSFSII